MKLTDVQQEAVAEIVARWLLGYITIGEMRSCISHAISEVEA